jgi:hypothetical protein
MCGIFQVKARNIALIAALSLPTRGSKMQHPRTFSGAKRDLLALFGIVDGNFDNWGAPALIEVAAFSASASVENDPVVWRST